MAVAGFFACFVLMLCVFFVGGVVVCQKKATERAEASIATSIAHLNEEIRRSQELSLTLTKKLEEISRLERDHKLLGQLIDRLNLEKAQILELETQNRELKAQLEKRNSKAAPKEEKPYTFEDIERYLRPGPGLWTPPDPWPSTPWNNLGK